MKKDEVFEMKTLVIDGDGVKVPEGWHLIKEPTKITENGIDVFKAVVARARG